MTNAFYSDYDPGLFIRICLHTVHQWFNKPTVFFCFFFFIRDDTQLMMYDIKSIAELFILYTRHRAVSTWLPTIRHIRTTVIINISFYKTKWIYIYSWNTCTVHTTHFDICQAFYFMKPSEYLVLASHNHPCMYKCIWIYYSELRQHHYFVSIILVYKTSSRIIFSNKNIKNIL